MELTHTEGYQGHMKVHRTVHPHTHMKCNWWKLNKLWIVPMSIFLLCYCTTDMQDVNAGGGGVKGEWDLSVYLSATC